MSDVVSTTQTLDGTNSWAVHYVYNYEQGVYTTTYPSGEVRAQQLDALYRPATVRNGDGSLLAGYSYQDLSSYSTVTYANGVTTRTDYDAVKRVTRVSSPVADYRYGYDGVGNRTYMQRVHQFGQPADVYQYDTLYQLTQVWYGADATNPDDITSYTGMAQYDLDALGNRLEVEDNGVIHTYGPHDDQQLTNVMNRYETVDGTVLAYDPRGNTLNDSINTYTYDALNRQEGMVGPNGTAEYIYDARGRRVARSVNGITIHYIYDTDYRVLEERGDDGELLALYTYGVGIDEVLTIERSGNIYYYRARYYSHNLGRFLSQDPLGFEAGDYNLYRYAFNSPLNFTDPTGQAIPLIIGGILIAVAIADYGLTTYDIYQSYKVFEDRCASDIDKLLAALNIALAVVFELVEPDDLLPIHVPADDIARRIVVGKARGAVQGGGIHGFEKAVRESVGDNLANDVFKRMGLDQFVRLVCSFSEETLISTKDGVQAISNLELGDQVLAYEEATGEIGYHPVVALWAHQDPVIVSLTIDGEVIETTPEHPFYTANGEWVTAADLHVDDEIRQANWDKGVVEAIVFTPVPQTMYNFTVATAHTYFVGEGQWLVHNCRAYANTAHNALKQLPENLRGATVAMSLGADSKPILAIYGRTPEITQDAINHLRNKGWNVLDAPPRGVEYHAERQLIDAGYTQIGISRQAGMCNSCAEYVSNHPGVTITPYDPQR